MKSVLELLAGMWNRQKLTAEIDLENTTIEIDGSKFVLSGTLILRELKLTHETSVKDEESSNRKT